MMRFGIPFQQAIFILNDYSTENASTPTINDKPITRDADLVEAAPVKERTVPP